LKGVTFYRSKSGFAVMRAHYSADPEKDPATPEGAKWLELELKGVPGGLTSSSWRQEMEVDWEAAGGDLVFPDFEPYRNKIVINSFEPPETWMLFGSYDYGQRNASCFLVHGLDYDQNVYTIWEFYSNAFGYLTQARIMKACPYWKRLQCVIADPQIFAKDQQQTASIGGDQNELKSIADLYSQIPDDPDDDLSGPIYFIPGKHGGDLTTAEWIKGNLWHDLAQGNPRWRIFNTCPFLIWEIGKLRYAEWTALAQETKNLREEVVSKDNHAWDSFKYFLLQFMIGPQAPKKEKYDDLKEIGDLASYREWRLVDKLHAAREATYADTWGE
jgi:hypothetical protein